MLKREKTYYLRSSIFEHSIFSKLTKQKKMKNQSKKNQVDASRKAKKKIFPNKVEISFAM
jgi:hypothetical protein